MWVHNVRGGILRPPLITPAGRRARTTSTLSTTSSTPTPTAPPWDLWSIPFTFPITFFYHCTNTLLLLLLFLQATKPTKLEVAFFSLSSTTWGHIFVPTVLGWRNILVAGPLLVPPKLTYLFVRRGPPKAVVDVLVREFLATSDAPEDAPTLPRGCNNIINCWGVS